MTSLAEKTPGLGENQSPSQTTENEQESVVPIADQTDLDGGENDTKPEEPASMGNYIVWNYLIPKIALSLTTGRESLRKQREQIVASSQ